LRAFSKKGFPVEKPGKVTPDPSDGSPYMGRAVDQAGAGAHGAINIVSDAARPAEDGTASSAHHAVGRITRAAGRAAQMPGENSDQSQNVQAPALEQCRNYVRANPALSLGIAIAAGYFLGPLLKAR
jgi:ElaB/YqjD/DUF883 family membrane-anchored ribosome-binding protein